MANVAQPAARARRSGREIRTGPLLAPSVVPLVFWAFVPLAVTLWFSLLHYNLLDPITRFVGFDNYSFLLTDPRCSTRCGTPWRWWSACSSASIVFGCLFAVLFDQEFYGRSVARLLVIAPFFVMPTVSALIWKNLLMHPVNGLFAFITRSLHLGVIDWFGDWPLTSVGIIVAWQWVPFATLILLTAIQSLDREQVEAARMDGAKPVSMFFFIILPHLARPISRRDHDRDHLPAVDLCRDPGHDQSAAPATPRPICLTSSTRPRSFDFDVGGGSAGGIVAVILANIVAIFLVRTVARSLD